MEVVYEGILELGYNVNSKSSKNWKPYLFVLKYDSSRKMSILDYYKSTSKRWQKQSPKGSISLPESFELSLAHQCSYKYTLRLMASEKTYYLACNSSKGMNKWFYWIQTQQIMVPAKENLIFDVTAQESDAMSVIGVSGNCRLVLTSSNYEVHCVLLPKKQIAAVWPFECLRSYSYGNGLFSIQAGRHSPHGPGEFSFLTSQDKLIHDQLERLINKRKRNSTTSESSSRFSVSDRPPARLPNEDSSSESPVSSGNSDSDMEHLDNARRSHALEPASTFEMTLGLEDHLAARPPPVWGLPPKLPPKGVSQRNSGELKAEWFNRRFGHALNGEREAPVGSENSEDHVYSHTSHQTSAGSVSPTSANDPLVYNSLVREGASLTSPTKKEEGMVYDVAYPHQVPVHVPNYDIAYTKERASPSAKAKGEASFSPPRPPKFGDDETTPNPLYGSQRGSFLEDSVDGRRWLPAVSHHYSSEPSVGHQITVTGPKTTVVPDVTANPVYVTSTVGQNLPVPQPVVPAAIMVTTTSSQHTAMPQHNSGEVEQQPMADASGGKIYTPEKDYKGYTKISKTSMSPVPQIPETNEDGGDPHNSSSSNSSEGHPVSSSLESDPPQVPERLYDSDC